ncbi:MAG: peptide chain release factor 1 [Oscillospiraceae bacterium]
MLEKLKVTEDRFEEINRRLMDPYVVNDNEIYKQLMKEHKMLMPIVEKYRECVKAEKAVNEAKELLDEGGMDPELKEMATEQLLEGNRMVDKCMDELKILLLPKDPDDDKSCIVEIRGGAGGDEAALFANSLYRMYSMYSEIKHWKTEILYSNETELGGFKEVSFSVEGDAVFSRLKFESGVHRVQRVPDTEASGRIHTSTVTVAVLPEVGDVEINIDPGDLQVDTYRSGGAGGQHVNKTESAIRITHIPTGLVVECQDERSQHKNRDKAMKVLKARLYDKKLQEQNDKIASDRKSQVGTGDRSERIRTYNYPQGRVTDHRIGLTLYKLEQVLNGDLDELLDAIVTFDQTEKLKLSAEGKL